MWLAGLDDRVLWRGHSGGESRHLRCELTVSYVSWGRASEVLTKMGAPGSTVGSHHWQVASQLATLLPRTLCPELGPWELFSPMEGEHKWCAWDDKRGRSLDCHTEQSVTRWPRVLSMVCSQMGKKIPLCQNFKILGFICYKSERSLIDQRGNQWIRFFPWSWYWELEKEIHL